MLEVVQQEEELLIAQIGFQMLEGGAISALRQTKCADDRGDDQVRVADGGQRDETDALSKLLQHLRAKRQSQACLADARGAGERQQPHLWTQQPGMCCL